MVWCATPKENKNGIETWAVASMFSMNFDHGFFSTDGALMEIIPHERKATLAFYEETAATSFGNEYEIFICGSNMYYPEYDEEGLLLHYTDWKSASEIKYPDGKGIYAASFEFINNAGLPLQFALKPLKDYPGQVYVIYSYELEDGTRYSSEPIPYRDLCPVE